MNIKCSRNPLNILMAINIPIIPIINNKIKYMKKELINIILLLQKQIIKDPKNNPAIYFRMLKNKSFSDKNITKNIKVNVIKIKREYSKSFILFSK